ncbi:MAG: hypothetical protein ACPGUV_14560, partial [Polyangiales bacterium]
MTRTPGGGDKPRLWATLLGWGLACAMLLPGGAQADEIEDFEAARRAYEAQDYSTAKTRFEALVGGPIPQVQSRPLLLESRKYLAVTYLFLQQKDKAQAQFRALLRADSGYVLDPVSFPSEAVQLFGRIKAQVEAEQRRARAAAEAARRRREAAEAAKQAKARERRERLLLLAQSETIERQRSRWLAAVPFGAGQFQN